MRVNKFVFSLISFCPFFGGIPATVFTKPGVIRDLFDLQTSAVFVGNIMHCRSVHYVRILKDGVTSPSGENEHQL